MVVIQKVGKVVSGQGYKRLTKFVHYTENKKLVTLSRN